MRRKIIELVTAAALTAGAVVAGLVLSGQPAGAAVAVSTPSTRAGWAAANTPGTVRPEAVYSADLPRYGSGSLKLDTTAVGSQRSIYAKTTGKLSAVTELSYEWRKVPVAAAPAGAEGQTAAYVLWIDADGNATTADTTALVYEPVYQRNGKGSPRYPDNELPVNTWVQDNDLVNGCWGDTGACKTFKQFQAEYPDATLLAYGLNQGTGNDGVLSYADAVSLNGNRSNFEINAAVPYANFFSQPQCGVVKMDFRNLAAAPAESTDVAVRVSGVTVRTATLDAGGVYQPQIGPFAEDSRGGKAVVDLVADGVVLRSKTYTTNCRK